MSEYVKLEGSFKYTKVDPNNPEPPFAQEKSGKWSTLFYPNPDALEIIREIQTQGLKNTMKKDEDGYNMKFSRPCEIWRQDKTSKEWKMIRKLDPPKITGAIPSEIGNGSLGSITLDVYEHNVPGSTRKAKAARLYAMDITRLTPRT